MESIRQRTGITKKSLLVDTNLLLLLLVGLFDPTRISRFKRTQQFTSRDFEILLGFLQGFEVVTTPHILTEISNLGGQLSSDLVPGFREVCSRAIQRLKEITQPSAEIAVHELFVPLGLTDAAIGLSCSTSIAVLTEDGRLAAALGRKGVQVLPFELLRAMSSA